MRSFILLACLGKHSVWSISSSLSNKHSLEIDHQGLSVLELGDETAHEEAGDATEKNGNDCYDAILGLPACQFLVQKYVNNTDHKTQLAAWGKQYLGYGEDTDAGDKYSHKTWGNLTDAVKDECITVLTSAIGDDNQLRLFLDPFVKHQLRTMEFSSYEDTHKYYTYMKNYTIAAGASDAHEVGSGLSEVKHAFCDVFTNRYFDDISVTSEANAGNVKDTFKLCSNWGHSIFFFEYQCEKLRADMDIVDTFGTVSEVANQSSMMFLEHPASPNGAQLRSSLTSSMLQMTSSDDVTDHVQDIVKKSIDEIAQIMPLLKKWKSNYAEYLNLDSY